MADVPLHQHWRDILDKRWLILITGLTAAVVATAFSNLVTPIFESKTTFYLAGNAQMPSYVGSEPDAPPGVLYPIPEEKAASLDVGILLGREMMSRLAERYGIPLSVITRRVDITVSREFMINVYARDPDAARSADIANSVPRLYAEFQENSMRSRSTAIAEALEDRLAVLEAERESLNAALLRSRSENLSVTDEAALRSLQGTRDADELKIADLDRQIMENTARLAVIDDSLRLEGVSFSEFRTMETTMALNSMLERVLDLRIELAAITDGPASPRRAAIEDQIAAIETSMEKERQRLADATSKTSGSLFEKLRLERAMVTATIAGLQAARETVEKTIDAASREFQSALVQVSAAEEISNELARVRNQIATAQANLAAARIQATNAKVPMVITETAVASLRPVFPLTVLNAIVATIVGLVFGVYYALFVAHSERAGRLHRAQTAELPLFTSEELTLLRRGDIGLLSNGSRAGSVSND